MREFLTFIGIVLCLALAALMAGPHFVDWGQYRSVIEQRIAAVAGAPAVIEGPIAVTLLPTPSIALDQVRIGAADARNLRMFEAERIVVAVSATSLLRGEIHVTDAQVEAPILRLRAGALPSLPGGVSGSVSPEQVSIGALKLRDGRIVIERPGEPDVMVSAIATEIEASSLIGPAQGSGSFLIGDSTRNFRFALGKYEAGRSRVKALIEDLQMALRLDVDGAIAPDEKGGTGFDGSVHLSGNPHFGPAGKEVQVPIRATARANFGSGRIEFSDVSMMAGADPQPFNMSGTARMFFEGRQKIEATLSARSFDFDRPGPDGKPRLANPADLIRQAMLLIPGGNTAETPDFAIDLSVGGIIVGGQTIIGGRVALVKDPMGTGIVGLEGELPGQTRVKLLRAAASQAGPLAGRVEVESRDPERFLNWFSGQPVAAGSQLALKASANVESTKEGIAFRAMLIERGETRLEGHGHFLFALPGLRPAPQLALKLTSPRLNVVDIPSLAAGDPPDADRAIDFDLDIEAGKLVFDGSDTGRLVARIRRDGQIVSIERIAVSEFGGASLIASGTIGGGARRVTVKLDATKVEALAALGERLLPGDFTRSIRLRAPQLAPALLVAVFANEDADESYDIFADGHLGGTQIKASGKLSGRTDLALDLNVGLENPDAALLAAQIGGRQPVGRGSGPAKIELSMRGNPRRTLSTAVSGVMAGIDAKVIGNIRIFQPFAPFEGDVTIKATDLSHAAAAMGIGHPVIPLGTPGTLSGRVVSNLERITIEDLKADIAGQPYAGEIAFSLLENGKVAGQIKTPYVDFRPVLGLALGQTKPGLSHFAADGFGKPLAPPLPGDLWVEADRARLDDRTVLSDAKFVLRFDTGAASVEYAQFGLDQTRIEGDVFLRRSETGAFLSSKLKASSVRLERFGAGAAKGLIDAELQFSGGGDTPARLVTGLAGGGSALVRHAQAPRFDPRALNRLLAIPIDKLGPLDIANLGRKLEAELDRTTWNVPETKVPLVMVNGVLRTGTTAFEGGDVRHEAQASLDLGAMALDLRIATTSTTVPADWRGAQPQFTTHWRGPLSAPSRSVSLDSLVNGYLSLSLVRDLEKTEIFEQDIRERAAHNRRLKADEAIRRRDDELARFELAERERLERERRLEEQRQLEARLAQEAREKSEREKAEREAAEARERLKKAEEERLLREKIAEDERKRVQAEAEESRQRQARAAEEEAARIQRIERILQQPETTATPVPSAPRRSVAPQPQAAPLPPPMNINPGAAGRPRVAAPVEIRPLAAPAGADSLR